MPIIEFIMLQTIYNPRLSSISNKESQYAPETHYFHCGVKKHTIGYKKKRNAKYLGRKFGPQKKTPISVVIKNTELFVQLSKAQVT